MEEGTIERRRGRRTWRRSENLVLTLAGVATGEEEEEVEGVGEETEEEEEEVDTNLEVDRG